MASSSHCDFQASAKLRWPGNDSGWPVRDKDSARCYKHHGRESKLLVWPDRWHEARLEQEAELSDGEALRDERPRESAQISERIDVCHGEERGVRAMGPLL